ncbi:exonuclease domain-containing protein [Pseudoruegeria sp. SK021]|uniref:exonuclease domain-containing protein n=1 Tax=Pseudoruegeria sp. SK021 TaxID=1933035 RepID=UPI001F0AF886|nr:exonuclease domain-containing protein [Pseudoruegeria sp. SK021]
MWRLRNDPETKADGDIAKKVRNAFIAEYCGAVWVPLADDLDISGLEAQVIDLAPKNAVAWNRRGMDAYEEPTDLVDFVIGRLGFGAAQRAALDRQKMRFLGGETPSTRPAASGAQGMKTFPKGPFRFEALDVETANNNRASICQIGVACVRPDNSIETWVTYVDPQTSRWVFTGLHGISNATVRGAPNIAEVLPVLEVALSGLTVYQHSGFDRSAIRAACAELSRPEPEWDWQNSVTVARQAWPELKGNGGHGLASLKGYLGLSFEHHDAGEDARAAAEVVLHAENSRRRPSVQATIKDDDDFDVVDDTWVPPPGPSMPLKPNDARLGHEATCPNEKLIGFTVLTDGHIKNNHFYLRDVLAAFPEDCIGGPNAASAAPRSVLVRWGASSQITTDIDGKKKLFRKRGWVREFFETNAAQAGNHVQIYELGPYEYEVSVHRE